ncbi:bifunctional diguanylate cyclase/phosphodiesterase [Curvibacter gracilis]|uniref:bifunctional diguanylate cyclase/phosphodiesterase n=1 Tax=Curvibacter gracilis TaxID=230310 RepID=UPI0004B67F31|nr:EAL domain-containing protein [Curvibacter gracilis]
MKRNGNLHVWLLAALVFCATLVVGGLLRGQVEKNHLLESRSVAKNLAHASAHAIEERLGRSLSATYALAAVVAQGNGRVDDFDALCRQLILTFGGISNLQLAPGGVVAAISPLAGNEKAMGHNLLEDNARNKEARLALATHKLTLAGPFELVQGGLAVVGRLPVYLPGKAGAPSFWGFTTALVLIPDLLQSSQLNRLGEQGYRYQLWRIHPDTRQRQIIAGLPGPALEAPVDTTLEVPIGSWTLSVEPVQGWSSPADSAWSLLACVSMAALLALLTHTLLMQPVRLRRQVALRTQELEQANAQLAGEIEERRKAEESQRLAANVFTFAREAISITDAQGTIIDVNAAFSRITGYERAEVLGKNPRMLQSGRQSRAYYQAMWRSLTDSGYWAGEIWNRRKNGEVFAELLTISAVKNAEGVTQNYVALFTDITPMKEQQKQLEHIAHYDALTDLPNRTLLADRLQQAMAQTQRRGQSLAVAYLDLDGFKTVNDTHGHAVGDELLVALAARLMATLREGDTLSRIGGDEFVAILVDLESVSAHETVLLRLLEAASTPVKIKGLSLQVSVSIGLTLYPQDNVSADQLMRHADQAMYIAKQGGKNRYHLFDVIQDSAVKTHREQLAQIRAALHKGEFVLYYQPKVDLQLGRLVGVEALIRWQSPQAGLQLPGAFLPAIENDITAIDLGEWVIAQALHQLSEWHAAGLQISVSVNIGARQLQQANFKHRLARLMHLHLKVDPTYVELEILETSALEDIEQASQAIRDCRALGVRFALDDFGTGYSSLTYLKHLPVEVLKIDSSFVSDMLDDPDDLSIVRGVVSLAEAFGREVIAEGVESVAHGQALRQLGCRMAQGFGIARPMPAAELLAWQLRWDADPGWRALRQEWPVSQAAPL